jgi:hypothetical protein
MTILRGMFFAITAFALVAVPLLVGTTGPRSDSGSVYAANLVSAPPGEVVHQSNSPNPCDGPNEPTTDRCGYTPAPGTPYVHVDEHGNWSQVNAEDNDGDDNDNDDNDNDDNDND